MIDPLLIEEQIGQILREDIGFGDLTSTIMIDEDTTGVFDVNAREEIVVAGMAVAAAIFKRCEPGCTFEPKVYDGDHITDGTTMAGPRQNVDPYWSRVGWDGAVARAGTLTTARRRRT